MRKKESWVTRVFTTKYTPPQKKPHQPPKTKPKQGEPKQQNKNKTLSLAETEERERCIRTVYGK